MSLQMTANKVVNWGKQNSPYLLFTLGMVSMCGAVAEAIHATTKLGYILDAREDSLNEIDSYYEEELLSVETPEIKASLEKNRKKEVAKINRGAVWDITKLYAPTAAIMALSIFSFGSAFSILRKRFMGVSAALAATTEAFNNYRDRVRAEEDGELKDYAYLHGMDIEEVTETEVDENGKKHKVTKKKLTGSPKGLYTFKFEKYDPSTETGFTQWQEVNTYSQPFVMGTVSHGQRRLEIGKMVMLFDILRDLGAGDDLFYEEYMTAGWLPGDIILCGLEEGADIMSGDATDYLYGNNPDVTLIFNCRPNVFAPEQKKPDVITTAKEVA